MDYEDVLKSDERNKKERRTILFNMLKEAFPDDEVQTDFPVQEWFVRIEKKQPYRVVIIVTASEPLMTDQDNGYLNIFAQLINNLRVQYGALTANVVDVQRVNFDYSGTLLL